MMTDLASLGIAIDSKQVTQASGELQKLVTAGGQAQTSANQLKSAWDSSNSSLKQMADIIAQTEAAEQAAYRSTVQQTQAIQAQTQAIQQQITQISAANNALLSMADKLAIYNQAKSNGSLGHFAIQNALGGAAGIASIEAAIKAEQDVGREAEKVASSVGKAGIQMSLFTRELVTMGREAGNGNFTRLAGSSTLMLQSLGLLTPEIVLTVAAVAAAVAPFALLAYEMEQGADEAAKLQNAIQLTGNYAGIAEQQINGLAQAFSSKLHAPVGQVEQDLTTLISSGKFTSDTIQLMTQNAIIFGQMTGQSSQKVIQYFSQMDAGVTQFALKYEDSYHSLTAAQIDHIQKLEEEGNKAQAEQELQRDLYNDLSTKAPASLGILAQAWLNINVAISGALQALRDFGKESLADRVQDAAAKLKTDAEQVMYARRNGNMNGDLDNWLAIMNQDKATLAQLQTSLFNASPAGEAAAQQRQNSVNAAQGAISTLNSIKNSAELATEKVTQFNNQLKLALQGDPNNPQLLSAQAHLAEIDEQIRKRYDAAAFKKTPKTDAERYQTQADKVGSEADSTLAAAQAYLQGDAAGQQYEARIKALADAIGKKVPLSEQELFIQNSLDLEIAKSLNQQDQRIAKMRDQNTIQDIANGYVQQGFMTTAEANEYVKEQIALLPAQTALVNAHSAAEVKAAKDTLAAQQAVLQQNYYIEQEKAILANNEQMQRQNNLLLAEIGLANQDNVTRAVAIAQLQEIAKLKAQGIDIKKNPDAQNAIGLAGANAGLNAQLQTANALSFQDQARQMALQALQDQKFQQDRVARYKAATDQINAIAKQFNLDETVRKRAQAQVDEQFNQERLARFDSMMTELATLSQSGNAKLKAIGKAAAVAQAVVDDANNIITTFGKNGGWPWGAVAAAAMAAADAVQISKIISAADGGYISGPGGPKDDKIPARLSNGEFVVVAEAVRDPANRQMLEMMNRGFKPPHFASGGIVGTPPVGTSNVTHAPYFDFRGANFGGADPNDIEARFRHIMDTEYAPIITKNAATAAVVATSKVQNRQKLNRNFAQRTS